MEKYIIAIDLDDTLLHTDKSISNYSKEILKRCQEIGCKIVVSTARSYSRSISFAKEINADYISSYIGNYVCDSNKTIIYKNPIDIQTSKNVIEYLYKNTKYIINEGIDKSYCLDNSDIEFLQSNKVDLDTLKKFQSYRLFFRCENNKSYDKIEQYIKLNNMVMIYSSVSGRTRIIPQKSNKWNGIEKIKEHLNSNFKSDVQYKVIAFGDDFPDLESLQNADIGVRMKNSNEKIVKEISNVTLSNNDDGVAKFLEHFFKEKNYEF